VDVHVSFHLRDAGIWEPHMLRHFQNVLYQDPQLGVYDIGANIGQYSLVAAAMGRKVVAVEPHLPSLRRLHKAIKLGKLEEKVRRANLIYRNLHAHIVQLLQFNDTV